MGEDSGVTWNPLSVWAMGQPQPVRQDWRPSIKRAMVKLQIRRGWVFGLVTKLFLFQFKPFLFNIGGNVYFNVFEQCHVFVPIIHLPRLIG